jgi:hypothetical protein
MNGKPNPGSDEALAQGCRCPVMDNAHGRGAWGTWDKPEGEKVFVMSGACPLHGEAVRQAKEGA